MCFTSRFYEDKDFCLGRVFFDNAGNPKWAKTIGGKSKEITKIPSGWNELNLSEEEKIELSSNFNTADKMTLEADGKMFYQRYTKKTSKAA